MYSSNAKELGHEDLPEEDRVRVSKILSMLSSTVNSLESSIRPLIEKQVEEEARKILDIIAGKVKELARKDVEMSYHPLAIPPLLDSRKHPNHIHKPNHVGIFRWRGTSRASIR
ncbi:MAG: hypothetical protein RQ885_15235 [Desulfurococcales archaeon]|nr:hypothetical protein [Desulfurococcales archaeon]